MRILYQTRPELAAEIEKTIPGVELVSIPSKGDLPAGTTGDVLLTYTWGSPNLGRVLETTGVRWIHALGTGVDAFPFEQLQNQLFTCSRGASAVPIAEWVLTMMLAFEKRIPASWVDAPPERWSRASLGQLDGKTLGLVGLGGIGLEVARRGLAFGMRVRGVRRTDRPPPLPQIETAESLRDLVASADHLALVVPATPATQHLIDDDILAAAKKGLHLVNVARGSLVDQDALRRALDDGRVAMASLDAVEPEPLPPGHWMYGHAKVRLSPHISWNAPDAAGRLLDVFIENVSRFRDKRQLIGVIDRGHGY